MLLTHSRLVELVRDGTVQNSDETYVNQSSIDVHLAENFMVEYFATDVLGHCIDRKTTVDLSKKQRALMVPYEGSSITLEPRQFVLAATREVFNLPPNLSMLFVMKSSLARSGLDQMSAAWCNPGWSGSALTLELYNVLSHHRLRIEAGMPIGQMVVFEGPEVPAEVLYSVRGAFNWQAHVSDKGNPGTSSSPTGAL